ncbi:CRISPR-associated protein Cas4 [Eubacteriaceae bacterium ES3]|nr:CRISPR-associated protein Cas4 [Eubacteriaceae bacterium ES3]
MKEITGVMVSYSYLCLRKLWLFSNHLNMEENHENVTIGKLLDEHTYEREKKHFSVDGINIDFIKKNVIYEIKKSDAELEMAVNQVKYYLYTLQKRGMVVKYGVINVPTKKMTKNVELTNNDIIVIEERLAFIREIIDNSVIPERKRIPACKSCAYFELCFI